MRNWRPESLKKAKEEFTLSVGNHEQGCANAASILRLFGVLNFRHALDIRRDGNINIERVLHAFQLQNPLCRR